MSRMGSRRFKPIATSPVPEQLSSIGAKFLVYEKFLDWVLTKQQNAWLDRDLTALETVELKRILAEAGLCVVQTGKDRVAVSLIEERLQDSDSAKSLLASVRQRFRGHPLRNDLAKFYFQDGEGLEEESGVVEFTHKSFAEFLCAERLKVSLENWSRRSLDTQDFQISAIQMDWEIYDLLGYGGLTVEVVAYLMALLVASQDLDFVSLFDRLEQFYHRWCKGEFIDALGETLPQKKMKLLKQGSDSPTALGQRQVDVYVGLNVLILLLELDRHAQSEPKLQDKINFYPCGQKHTPTFAPLRLFHIVSYSHCITDMTFTKVVGPFLAKAKLSGADLGGADLNGANLSGANLISANLSGADLSRANLSGAELSGADMNGANLSGASLSGAYLSDAYLSGTYLVIADLSKAYLIGADLSHADLISANLSDSDLNGADLSGANLSGANLSRAQFSGAYLNRADLISADLSGANLSRAHLSHTDLEHITWDNNTKWDDIKELDTAIDLPAALKRQLGLQ